MQSLTPGREQLQAELAQQRELRETHDRLSTEAYDQSCEFMAGSQAWFAYRDNGALNRAKAVAAVNRIHELTKAIAALEPVTEAA